MKFATHAVLSTCTGKLLGDIGGVYEVTSYLIGRSAFTHELAFYGRRAAAALKAGIPALPTDEDAKHVTGENYRQFVAGWVEKLGAEVDLPESLRECLADDRGAVDTLTEMVGKDRVIVVNPKL